MGDRGADPLAPALVCIHTDTGGTFYARAEDIEAARTNGDRNVPLCRADGQPVTGAIGRGTLRLSTIEISELRPHHPPQTPAQIQTDDMRPDDKTMLNEAKVRVDLPGFLALHGYTVHTEKDARANRILRGPGGERLRVSIDPTSKHWVYEDLHAGGGGSILDACQKLLGMGYGQALGAIRRANAAPPSPLGVGRSGFDPTTPRRKLAPRTLAPLSEIGATYLTETRQIDPVTVAAFHHALNANDEGTLVFAHNRHGDGEERGAGKKPHFHGGEQDGEGRGRSLWVAVPHGAQEPPKYMVVAESGIGALSGWEMVPANLQPDTGISSTGGFLGAASKAKLEAELGKMVEHHGEGVPILVDGSDRGEVNTERRTTWLRDLAARIGVQYERAEPTLEGCKDWNEELVARKNAAMQAQEAQDAAEAEPSTVEPGDTPTETQETRSKGRGR